MTDAPERIWLRWVPGKAVTSGPLTYHPDYAGYVHEDIHTALQGTVDIQREQIEALTEQVRQLQERLRAQQ